jgi:xanthine dehydrogenase accessory factor
VSKAFYVGALGSRANSAKRRARLKSLDVPEPALARLHAPVGLPIGSRTPAEIAVAILAELTAVRYGRTVTVGDSAVAPVNADTAQENAACAGLRASC